MVDPKTLIREGQVWAIGGSKGLRFRVMNQTTSNDRKFVVGRVLYHPRLRDLIGSDIAFREADFFDRSKSFFLIGASPC